MRIQLQSVLLPAEEVCDVTELYYHRREQTLVFDGYFNLFCVNKRKRYTNIKKLILQISLKGYAQICLYHSGNLIEKKCLDEQLNKVYELELPYETIKDGAFWFELEEAANCMDRKVSGMYIGEIEEEKFQTVKIGAVVCTFQREAYVLKNLTRFEMGILKREDLEVSRHIELFYIDNGKTLDSFEPVKQYVERYQKILHIIKNRNAGGSGGFTRGMLEILNDTGKEKFTHVLLMDDDATIEPDCFVRIYGFLSTIKSEWKSMTIGGTLLREEIPYLLYSAGEWWERGYTVNNPNMNLDLRKRENVLCKYLTETDHEKQQYSGWWCCCYSLNTVRKDNLPIPLFIHHDDIEYGIRNRKNGIVFLNGVSVWHRDVELTLPGANTYYDVRNLLIEIALQKCGRKTAAKCIAKRYAGAVLRYRYLDMALITRGIQDFQKGVEWLHRQNPEKLHQQIRSAAQKSYKIEELQKFMKSEELETVQRQIAKMEQDEEQGKQGTADSQITAWKWITLNGWLLPAKNQLVVMRNTDSAFTAFRKKKIVLYDPQSKKVMLFQKDYRKLMKETLQFLWAFWQMVRFFNRVEMEYNQKIATITNQTAWEKYLNEKETGFI